MSAVAEDAIPILIGPMGRFFSEGLFVAIQTHLAACFGQKPAMIRPVRGMALHTLTLLCRRMGARALRRLRFDF